MKTIRKTLMIVVTLAAALMIQGCRMAHPPGPPGLPPPPPIPVP